MLPEYLMSTLELLRRGYPTGIPDDEYLPLLSVLGPHMSDRTLAQVVAEFTGKPFGVVQNDVYGISGREAPVDDSLARRRLLLVGLEAWTGESDVDPERK